MHPLSSSVVSFVHQCALSLPESGLVSSGIEIERCVSIAAYIDNSTTGACGTRNQLVVVHWMKCTFIGDGKMHEAEMTFVSRCLKYRATCSHGSWQITIEMTGLTSGELTNKENFHVKIELSVIFVNVIFAQSVIPFWISTVPEE